MIEQACVTVRKGEERGRGVLVDGELILTAAHCVTHTIEGHMVLGDYFVQEIETSHGLLRVQPLAVEPVADIAVVGALDDQAFFDDASAFEDWCHATPPVPLSLEDFHLQEPFPVYVLTHRGLWLEGTAELFRNDAPMLWMTVPAGIEGGTSGSPVVTAHGALVGIVSHMGATAPAAFDKGTHGSAPRPHLTLPVWIVRRIQDGAASEEDPAT